MAKQKRQVDIDIKVDDKEVDGLIGKLDKLSDPIEDATDSAKELTGQLGKANKQIQDAGNSKGFTQLFSGAVAGVRAYIGSLKIAKVALAAATGGLTLIFSAIATIGAAFTKTKSGGEALRMVTSVVETAFKYLGKSAEWLYLKIRDAFNDPKQAIVDFGSSIKTFVIDRITDSISAVGLFAKALKEVFQGDFAKAMKTFKEASATLTAGSAVGELVAVRDLMNEVIKEIEQQQETYFKIFKKVLDEKELNRRRLSADVTAVYTAPDGTKQPLTDSALALQFGENLKHLTELKKREQALLEDNGMVAFMTDVKKAYQAKTDKVMFGKDIEPYIKAVAEATAKEQQLQQVIDDATISLEKRKAAAKELYEGLGGAESVSVQKATAEFNLLNKRKDLLQKNYDLEAEGSEGQLELVESLAEAKAAAFLAEKNIALVRLQNATSFRQAESDLVQQRLDEEIDLYDNIRTIQERGLADESKTLTERKKILDELIIGAEKSYNKQLKAFDTVLSERGKSTLKAAVEENDLEKQTKLLQNLGLSEELYTRILEVVRERRTVTSELQEAEVALGRTVRERYNELLQYEQLKSKVGADYEKGELELKFNKEVKLFEDAFNAKLFTQEEYQKAVILLRQKLDADIKEIDDAAEIRFTQQQEKELKEEGNRLDRLNRIGADAQRLKMLDIAKAYNEEMAFVRSALEDKIIMQEEATRLELLIVEKRKNDILAIEKELRDEKLALIGEQVNGTLDAASQVFDAFSVISDLRLTNIDEEEKAGKISEERAEELRRQAFEDQKKFSIAQTAIQTIQAAQSAFTSLASIPVVGVGLGIAAAAAAGVAGAARIAQIKRQTYDGAGDTSGGDTGQGVERNPVANANFFGVGNESQSVGARNQRVGNRQENDRVLRAVVLESDITDSQIRTNNLIRRSKIGG